MRRWWLWALAVCIGFLLSGMSYAEVPKLERENQLLAQSGYRSGSPRRRTRQRGRPRVILPSEGIKAGGGLVFNALDSTPLIFAGDYELPLVRWVRKRSLKDLMVVFGGSYWTSDGASVFTMESGLDFHVRLQPRLSLYGGARISYGRISIETNTRSVGDSQIFLTPVFGTAYRLSRTGSVGGEFRLAIGEKVDSNYLIGYYKFHL